MEAAIPYTAGVFISYRRQDTAFPAGWLYGSLVKHFGESHIFKDVDSIQPGEDFVEVITRAVTTCHTMLVLIGPRWMIPVGDPAGEVDKRSVGDFVQLEVATALSRGLQVIPILVGDVAMPAAADLPESIRALARRNAVELSPNHFEADLRKLLPVIERARQASQDRAEEAARRAAERRRADEERARREAERRLAPTPPAATHSPAGWGATRQRPPPTTAPIQPRHPTVSPRVPATAPDATPRRRVAVIGIALTTVVVVALGLVVVVNQIWASNPANPGPGAVSAALDGVRPITLAQGKDTSGFVRGVVDGWNQQHPDQKATLVELPDDADAQRQQMIQNANAKSDAYSVLAIDSVWTAEFAAYRYIVELPQDQFPLSELLPPVIDSAEYNDRLFAIPSAAEGGLLYYRTDLLVAAGIAGPPKTWAELIDDCKKIQATPQGANVNCYAGQFQKYEGLTVNAAEAINSAGGVITDKDGKPDVNTTAARQGLEFLLNGFKDGYIPKEALTYKEEESRRAFQEGKLIFQRQWQYQYALANRTDGSSRVAGKFAVAPLPGLNGPGVSSLIGHHLGISSFAKNKKSALDFIKFYTSKENSQKYLELASQMPIYASIYDDPALQKNFPYLTTIKASILGAQPRPKVVRYADATLAIQDAAYGVLEGTSTVDLAVVRLQNQLIQITSS